ncbi:hypothetical protein LSH36_31g00011 [Paralvinella palmiformis]|uniref:Phosphatidylethanolamine-binding protein n=1 Tax=Paralvinella palmiformis TaxID=53620 RepID=A0AAD9K9W5_9ANNE|nr:hypothetical protein LSH36_31g00011 [Paralvinella palmiformis]
MFRNTVISPLCGFFVVMVTFCDSCHVLPEKVMTRYRLCNGPILILQDVGPCGTTMPKYLEDLSFKVYFGWAELTKTYLLLMVDVDAPMREYPLLADYIHWMIADIPGFDLRNGVMSSIRATELIAYMPPSPPPGSGLHRYQFFLFESPEDSTADDLVGYSPDFRARFNLTEFVIRNNLCYNLRATFEFSHQVMRYTMNHLMMMR